MNHFTEERNELVEIMKGAYEALYNKNLPEEARVVIKGSVNCCVEHARRGEFEIAKGYIQNLAKYNIK